MAHKKQLTTHRNYKDTVFRMLFSDRKNLLSLYNAISGSDYDNPEMLEIVTLENAIYMGMKNDLAFIIDTDLFLYEHQSTYNPNMPLTIAIVVIFFSFTIHCLNTSSHRITDVLLCDQRSTQNILFYMTYFALLLLLSCCYRLHEP